MCHIKTYTTVWYTYRYDLKKKEFIQWYVPEVASLSNVLAYAEPVVCVWNFQNSVQCADDRTVRSCLYTIRACKVEVESRRVAGGRLTAEWMKPKKREIWQRTALTGRWTLRRERTAMNWCDQSHYTAAGHAFCTVRCIPSCSSTRAVSICGLEFTVLPSTLRPAC